MTTTPDEADDDRIWDELYHEIVLILAGYGKESATDEGDFWVNDDNYGWRRHHINLYRLTILQPEVIVKLRALLVDRAGWEIIMLTDVIPEIGVWPPMGVTIRKHEIIDGLQREFLPEPYRSIVIPDSRPGTGYD